MGYLGTPYRVGYEAKDFRTGLTNIVGLVFKPDGSTTGAYSFSEMPGPLAGRYYFDYTSLTSDPAGEYLVGIYSPSEEIQTTLRVGLYPVPGIPPGVQAQLTAILTAIGQGAALGQVVGNIDASPEVIGIVDAVTEVVGKIVLDPGVTGVTEEDALASGQVDNNLEIRGEIAEDE